MIMEFVCHTAICSEVHLHGAPLQSQKTTIAEYSTICGIMPNAVWNSQYLLNSILRHTDNDLVESDFGNRVTGNEEHQ